MSVIPPDAFVMIIGAMKCGTSSLYGYLARHPAICSCVEKEPEFFSHQQSHGVRVARYESLWDFDPGRHRFALEASTGYTKYPSEPNVPRRISEYGLRPRFLYLVRDPFDRIESHFRFMKQQRGAETFASLADDHLIAVSSYHLQLERFREFFPGESFLVLDFDDLKAKPEAVLRRVYDFLGLDQAFFPAEYPAYNRTRRVSRAERLLGVAPPWARRAARALPPSVRRIGRRVLARVSGPEPVRRLSPSERARIFDRLQGDMARLHLEYGVDVERWGFAVPPSSGDGARPRRELDVPRA